MNSRDTTSHPGFYVDLLIVLGAILSHDLSSDDITGDPFEHVPDCLSAFTIADWSKKLKQALDYNPVMIKRKL